MKWLNKFMKLFCGEGDEDWIPSQFADMNDRQGPLAEECCDTSCDTAPIRQVGPVGWSCPRYESGKARFSPRSSGTFVPMVPVAASALPLTPRGEQGEGSAHACIQFGSFETQLVAIIDAGKSAVPASPRGEGTESLVFGASSADSQISETNPTSAQTPAEGPEESSTDAGKKPAPITGFERRSAVVQVDKHRHVLSNSKVVAAIVAEIKSKLGKPTRTRDNDLTIRYLANARCGELGIRPHHTRAIVERTIVLVYAPDEADMEAAKLDNSATLLRAHADYAYHGRSSLYRRFVSRRMHALFFSGPPTGSASA